MPRTVNIYGIKLLSLPFWLCVDVGVSLGQRRRISRIYSIGRLFSWKPPLDMMFIKTYLIRVSN